MAKRKKKKPRAKWPLRLFLAACFVTAGILALTIMQVSTLKYIDPPFTVQILWDRLTGDTEARPGFVWRPLEQMSPSLQQAVLAGEDQRFYAHKGFDLVEMKEAVGDIVGGGRVRGASTLSMQTARTVFLPKSRSVFRKAVESYYTVLIELLWPKRRILEIYLNTVDWGEGIMGAEAASWLYFKKPAQRLDRDQAARLAAILPNPGKWSPVILNSAAKKHYQRILKDMDRMPVR